MVPNFSNFLISCFWNFAKETTQFVRFSSLWNSFNDYYFIINLKNSAFSFSKVSNLDLSKMARKLYQKVVFKVQIGSGFLFKLGSEIHPPFVRFWLSVVALMD
jgi:hypothetical protein